MVKIGLVTKNDRPIFRCRGLPARGLGTPGGLIFCLAFGLGLW